MDIDIHKALCYCDLEDCEKTIFQDITIAYENTTVDLTIERDMATGGDISGTIKHYSTSDMDIETYWINRFVDELDDNDDQYIYDMDIGATWNPFVTLYGGLEINCEHIDAELFITLNSNYYAVE